MQLDKPSEAYSQGKDEKVCGDCPLKSKSSGGNGACYVVTIHGPDGVARGIQNGGKASIVIDVGDGRYTALSHLNSKAANRKTGDVCQTWILPNSKAYPLKTTQIPDKIDKVVRFGAWGDPAFTDIKVTRRLARAAKGFLGYTHQWRKRKNLAPFCMASIDPEMARKHGVSVADLKTQAHDRGYRTFRVMAEGDLPMADEVMCPNVTHGIQCEDCMLCAGATRQAKNICIPGHGTGKGAL